MPPTPAPTVRTLRRKGRRHDPDRRERLAKAAAEVLHRDGMLGLTHRAVASQAGVPLGSTTYHFRDREGLLAAALDRLTLEEIAVLEDWRASWDLQTQLEDALVALVMMYANERRDQSILAYEADLFAFRRPSIRKISDRWTNAFLEMISPHLTAKDADLVIAMLDGIILHGLAVRGGLDEAWARRALRTVYVGSKARTPARSPERP